MKNQYCVLFSTAGSMEEAGRIAEQLVQRRLAACVNIVPSVQSVYRWENKICKDTEALMIIKTTASRVEAVRNAIRELHSYQTPELISVPIQDGLPEYLDWLEEAVTERAGE